MFLQVLFSDWNCLINLRIWCYTWFCQSYLKGWTKNDLSCYLVKTFYLLTSFFSISYLWVSKMLIMSLLVLKLGWKFSGSHCFEWYVWLYILNSCMECLYNIISFGVVCLLIFMQCIKWHLIIICRCTKFWGLMLIGKRVVLRCELREGICYTISEL
jgi:hypothetical protein